MYAPSFADYDYKQSSIRSKNATNAYYYQTWLKLPMAGKFKKAISRLKS